MNYLNFPVGQAGAGTVVEVTLSGVESDVYLVDASNLAAMHSGRQFRYHGGHFKSSPVRLAVPHRGDWTVVVAPVGGRVTASVRVLSGAGA